MKKATKKKAPVKEKPKKPEGFKLPTGEIIERLMITHIKMWHLDEGISRAHEAGDLAAAGDLAIQARAQNALRSELREELNKRIDGKGLGTEKLEYVPSKYVKGR